MCYFMELPKGFDAIHRDLVIAKLGANGFAQILFSTWEAI